MFNKFPTHQLYRNKCQELRFVIPSSVPVHQSMCQMFVLSSGGDMIVTSICICSFCADLLVKLSESVLLIALSL
jgi:hypothetical protein